MAGQRGTATRASSRQHSESGDAGWVLFAGILLLMAGILNLVYGIAAIGSSQFYIGHSEYVFGDLKTWGWIISAIGGLQCCAAVGVWAEQTWGRWMGVGIASLSAVVQLTAIASYPLLSLAIVALDLFIIWGLIAHAGRLQGD